MGYLPPDPTIQIESTVLILNKGKYKHSHKKYTND